MYSSESYPLSLKRLGALAAVLLLLPACDKPEVVPSKVSLLTSHGWQLSAWASAPAYPLYTTNGSLYKTYTNLFEYWRATDTTCPLNRHYTFAAGSEDQGYERGAYSFQQGDATCGARFINQSGTWYTDTSSGKILLYLADKSSLPSRSVLNGTYTVAELSGSQLILSNKVQMAGSSTVYVYTYTFTAE